MITFACVELPVTPSRIGGLATVPNTSLAAIHLYDGISRQSRIDIWDVSSCERKRMMVLGDKMMPTLLCSSTDGGFLIFKSDFESVLIWNIVRDSVRSIKVSAVSQLSVSPDGQIAISGSQVQVFDINSNSLNWTFPNYVSGGEVEFDELDTIWPLEHVEAGHGMVERMPAMATFTPSGEFLIVSGDMTGNTQVLSVSSYMPRSVLTPCPLSVFRSKASNDYLLEVGHAPMGGFLWNLNTGKRVLERYFKDFVPGPDCFAFHPKLPYLATGGKAGILIVYDLVKELGVCVQTLGSETERLRFMEFASDGKSLIVAAEGGRVFVLDITPIVVTN